MIDALGAVLVVVTGVAGADGGVVGGDTLAKCKAESQALNTTRTVATCTAAGDDVTQPKADRVEALRLLGMALITEGVPDLAEDAFKKMLTLDPDATLGSDAGPSAQKLLAKARSDVTEASAANATSTVPASSSSGTTPSSATTRSTTSKPAGVSEVVTRNPAAAWTFVGVGGAIAVVSGVVLAASVYDRFYNRVPCADGSAVQCVPLQPMMFGLYSAEHRQQFFADATAWMGGAVLGVVVGATVATVGVVLATDS